MAELDELLSCLKNGKAAGVDNVPNELLKNTKFKFRTYLLTFLNKIIEIGEVPEELNIGKCMLVYKVPEPLLSECLHNFISRVVTL